MKFKKNTKVLYNGQKGKILDIYNDNNWYLVEFTTGFSYVVSEESLILDPEEDNTVYEIGEDVLYAPLGITVMIDSEELEGSQYRIKNKDGFWKYTNKSEIKKI